MPQQAAATGRLKKDARLSPLREILVTRVVGEHQTLAWCAKKERGVLSEPAALDPFHHLITSQGH